MADDFVLYTPPAKTSSSCVVPDLDLLNDCPIQCHTCSKSNSSSSSTSCCIRFRQ